MTTLLQKILDDLENAATTKPTSAPGGRRLSENKLRSFNWQAECVCFARMRAEGRDWKQIAEVFGLKQETDVLARIALGNVPGTENTMLQHNVSMDQAIRYLLPLRVETGRNPDNDNHG